jgi:hypothetical protein
VSEPQVSEPTSTAEPQVSQPTGTAEPQMSEPTSTADEPTGPPGQARVIEPTKTLVEPTTGHEPSSTRSATARDRDVVAAVPKQLLIGGVWRPAASGKTVPVEDPSTGQVLTEVADGGSVDA